MKGEVCTTHTPIELSQHQHDQILDYYSCCVGVVLVGLAIAAGLLDHDGFEKCKTATSRPI